MFFDSAMLLSFGNVDEFIDAFFRYLKQNNENYELLCRSNDSLFGAKKMFNIVCSKLLETCYNNPHFTDKRYLEIDIGVFVSGVIFEYIRYCRRESTAAFDEMYAYTMDWAKRFRHSKKAESTT